MKGQMKTYTELTKAQKEDLRKRFRSPYIGYYYKIYNRKVAYRTPIDRR